MKRHVEDKVEPKKEISFDVEATERGVGAQAVLSQMNLAATKDVEAPKQSCAATYTVVLIARASFEYAGVQRCFEKGVPYAVDDALFRILNQERLIA